jgi:hypothetical protein
MQPGTVYFTQLDATKLYTWYVESILNMAGRFNASLRDFSLVHMSDNQKNPHIPLYGSFYREWRHAFRNYYWDDPVLLPLLADGSLNYFPLGYSSHVHTVNRRSPKLPEQRTHAMTFLGNKKSGNLRRTSNIREIDEVTGINVTGQVNFMEFGFGSTKNYRMLMMDSKFCINVQGQFVECYRLYDALELGCIPVMIDEYDNINYRDRHLEQLHPLLTFPWTDSGGQRVSLWEPGVTHDNYTVTGSAHRVSSRRPDGATEVRTVYETKTEVLLGSGGAAVQLPRRTSYVPFNNGGGPDGAEGVSIVPFVWMRSVSEFADRLHVLLADAPAMEHLQRESAVWWRQVKEHYRREMKEKLCYPADNPPTRAP